MPDDLTSAAREAVARLHVEHPASPTEDIETAAYIAGFIEGASQAEANNIAPLPSAGVTPQALREEQIERAYRAFCEARRGHAISDEEHAISRSRLELSWMGPTLVAGGVTESAPLDAAKIAEIQREATARAFEEAADSIYHKQHPESVRLMLRKRATEIRGERRREP